MSEILKLSCQQLIQQTEEQEKYKKNDFTILQFLQKNSQFVLFIKYSAWAEYLNQQIVAIRKMSNNLCGNTRIDSRKKNEKIFNDLLSSLDISPLISCDMSNLKLLFNQDFIKKIFQEKIQDKQTLIYIYQLMQDQLKESQIFANIKALFLIYFCPTISANLNRYNILITQSKQSQNDPYYVSYFGKPQNSSIELKFQRTNNQKTKQWNLYSGDLLDFFKVQQNAELKICSNTYFDQLYFRKKMALCIKTKFSFQFLTNTRIHAAITQFGSLIAIVKNNQIMVLNIRNQKAIRKHKKNNIINMALSQNCQYLAACNNITIFLWNIQAQLIQTKLPFITSPILAIQFLSGTKLLVQMGDSSFYKVDLENTTKLFKCLESRIEILNKLQMDGFRIRLSNSVPIKLFQFDGQVLALFLDFDASYSALNVKDEYLVENSFKKFCLFDKISQNTLTNSYAKLFEESQISSKASILYFNQMRIAIYNDRVEFESL